LYLTAILNSAALLERVKPLQTLGLFGARHFDKYVFAIPIPVYDSTYGDHQELVNLAREAESSAAGIDLDTTLGFKAARTVLRRALDAVLSDIDVIVLRLIAPVTELAGVTS
jgi:hypothetical protein